MLKTTLSIALTAALLWANTSHAHVAGATADNNDKMTAPLTSCNQSSEVSALFSEFGRTGKMSATLGKWLNDPAIQSIAPYKVFDNVYNVGICWVSAWLIKTSDGLILIDSIYEPYTQQMLDNVRTLGFNPNDIKLVLLTHGHFDHVGGVTWLQKHTNAKFVMTKQGWQESIADAKQSQGKPNGWHFPAKADILVKDGDVLTLGDTTIHAYETPGHTWGTTSYALDVKDGDKTYHAITIGGLGLNAIDGPEQVEAYIKSVDRIKSLVTRADNPVTVHLTAHPFSTGLSEARAQLATHQPGQPHPLDDGQALIKQLDALRAAAVERLTVETAKGTKQ